jgi:arsenate reductase (glutaredoxin)
MTNKIYIYKGCDTCRKALRFIKENEIEMEVLPIRETPPTLEELQIMLNAYDGALPPLFNRSGQDYRRLNMKDVLPTLSKEEALELLHKNGNLIKRPFLTSKHVNVVGFNLDIWQELKSQLEYES